MLSELSERIFPINYEPLPVLEATTEDIEMYLVGSLRGGSGWHYCYVEEVGSWKNDPDCDHTG